MVMPLRLVPAPLRRRMLDSAEVPSDLASVTSIARDEEHPPRSVGMTRDGVEAIWRATERLYAPACTRHFAGAAPSRQDRAEARDRSRTRQRAGRRGETPVQMTPDTPVCIFSASKAMAAMPLHLLSQQKALSLLDPVSHYLRSSAERQARHHHLPAAVPQGRHPDHPTEGLDVAELLLDRDETLRLICTAAPDKPGHTTRITHCPRASSWPRWSRRSRAAASVASSVSTSARRSDSSPSISAHAARCCASWRATMWPDSSWAAR